MNERMRARGRSTPLAYSAVASVIIIAVFKLATARLWDATERAQATALEKSILSAASRQIAEGNLIGLGETLAGLQRDGQIRYAEIRHVGQGGGTLFQTSADRPADLPPAGLDCLPRKPYFRTRAASLVFSAAIPTSIDGGRCDVLTVDADTPLELVRFKGRLMSLVAVFVSGIVIVATVAMLAWHNKVIRLEVQNAHLQSEREAALGRLATQVAHDIRSPIAVLDALADDLLSVSEETRTLIRDSTQRIREIATSLIEQYRRDYVAPQLIREATPSKAVGIAPELIYALVDAIVREKRLQVRHHPASELDWAPEASSFAAFGEVGAPEFKRAVSNLVNNALEALRYGGKIHMRLVSSESRIVLEIRDNGVGC